MAELTLPREPGAIPGTGRERQRRFVSTSSDGLSGFWTFQSDAEIAAANAALAAEQAAIVQQNLRYTPGAVAQAAAAREANELRAKMIPDDEVIRQHARHHIETKLTGELIARHAKAIARRAAAAELPTDLVLQVDRLLRREPELSWDQALARLL
jgi:hypothetical protein